MIVYNVITCFLPSILKYFVYRLVSKKKLQSLNANCNSFFISFLLNASKHGQEKFSSVKFIKNYLTKFYIYC